MKCCQTCKWSNGKPLSCGDGAFVARKGGKDCVDYAPASHKLARMSKANKQDVSVSLDIEEADFVEGGFVSPPVELDV